mgnify:CR=1 FL=1
MSIKKICFITISVFLILIGIVSCFKKKEVSPSQKLKVVSTIGMISDIVNEIGGDKIEGIALMGPGVDPHLYRPSEGDVRKLNEAHLIFYNGLHLESKMLTLFDHVKKNKPVVAVTQTIPESRLLTPPEFEGFHDPHVWFDLGLWEFAVDVITTALIELLPAEENFFLTQKDRYLTDLRALKQVSLAAVQTIPVEQRVLVTAHDAFNYFGQFYDFEVKALQGISTQSEAGIEDVQALVQFIVDRQIPAIFVESSIPKRHLQAVQESVKSKGWNVEIGGELYSDALGAPDSAAGTYLGMIQHNVNEIVTALSKK